MKSDRLFWVLYAVFPDVFFVRRIVSKHIDGLPWHKLAGIVVDDKPLVCKPGKIMNIILSITKRFCFWRWGGKFLDHGFGSTAFYFPFLHNGFPRKIISCYQPLLFILIILQLAGGSHHIIFWKSDPHIEVSKFTLVFTLLKIGHGMPSFFIINCGLGIPLSNLVAFAIMTTPWKIVRQLHMKWRRHNNFLRGG